MFNHRAVNISLPVILGLIIAALLAVAYVSVNAATGAGDTRIEVTDNWPGHAGSNSNNT